MKQKEVSVKNNPGISKRFLWDHKSQKWVDTGKYRSTKRIIENGRSKRVSAVFDSFEDSKAFRAGVIETTSGGSSVKRLSTSNPNQRFTFEALVKEWKELHYLEIEITSQQVYDTKIPHFGFLNNLNVADINTSIVTQLVKHWLGREYPKPKDRLTFEKELDALKVILNFYRRHKNNAYFVPILPEHYRAADFTKRAESKVRGLKEGDLKMFLVTLKERYPKLYVLALTQVGFGLRIGEALGLCWEDIDLNAKDALIRRNIAWDRVSGVLFEKKRKNGKVLEVAIPEFLVCEFIKLRASTNGSRYVFHRNGELIKRQQVSKAYNRVLRDLGITYVSGTHMLRKTSGILARKITCDVYAASKLLDHSSVTITEKYYQEQLEGDKRKVAVALDSVLKSTNEGNDPSPEDPKTTSWPLVAPKISRPKLKLVSSNS